MMSTQPRTTIGALLLACSLLGALGPPLHAQQAAGVIGHAETSNGHFSFSPEAGLMAYADVADQKTKTWAITLVSLKTGRPVDTLRFTKNRVLSPAFSADGKTLAWLNSDGQIVLRDLSAKTERKIFYREPTPYERHLPTDSLMLAPGGKFAVINGRGLSFVDLVAGKLVAGDDLSATKGPILFSPDGTTAALNQYESDKIDVYELATKKRRRTLSALAHTQHCGLSPDGKTLAMTEPKLPLNPKTSTATTELLMHLVLWDVAEDKEIARFRMAPPNETGRTFGCVAFSPDGKTLAYGYEFREKSARLSKPMIGFVDVATGTPLAALFVPGLPTSLAFAGDGKSLVSQCGYKNVNNVDVYRVPALKAVSQEAAPAADLLVKDSVWVCESPSMVFTVLERKGESFKARIIHSAFDREVTGTIKDGRITWLAKDVQAARGNKGGDNEGTIQKDGTIDFVADGGRVRYTLMLKTDK